MKRLSAAFYSAVLLLGASSSHAEFQSHATVTTDYIFRGISHTFDGPVLQASTTYHWDNGVFAGIWGSQTEQMPDVDGLELHFLAGANRQLGGPWSYTLLANRYSFVSGDPTGSYNEISAGIEHRNGYRFLVSYAGDWKGRDAASVYYEFDWRRSLPAGVELSGTLGYFDTATRLRRDYAFGDIGLSYGIRRWSFDLRYHNTGGPYSRNFGRRSGSRLVFSVSAGF